MANTGKPTAASRPPTDSTAPAGGAAPATKIALALQGSFGHLVYAAGVLDAFRAHNHELRTKPGEPGAKTIEFALASGCVEMLNPLWRYLADQHSGDSLREAVVKDNFREPFATQVRIAPPLVRRDAWNSYVSGLVGAQRRWGAACLGLFSGRTPRHHTAGRRHGVAAPGAELNAAWQDLCTYATGIPGQMAFNPFFVAAKTEDLRKICATAHGPTIFTNATGADDLSEIYLYSGSDPAPGQLESMRGKKRQRRVLRLTPEYFFASGARPPYIAPLPVEVEGKTERWMEGALRCNPPLTPLIDMGATHIVLLRFFCKEAREEPNNNAELNERFLDAVFNIPLQKEIESITFNNTVADCLELIPPAVRDSQAVPQRRKVTLIDPGDGDNPEHCPGYTDFLHHDLGTLSHHDGQTADRRGEMFDRGFAIGRELIRHLRDSLP